MSEDLKRCPLCGGEAEPADIDEKTTCINKDCGLSGCNIYVVQWQVRPLEDELMSMVEAIKRALKKSKSAGLARNIGANIPKKKYLP